MITYNIFFKTMAARGESQYTLRKQKIIPQSVLTRMRNNENVSTKTIDTLCEWLKCMPQDIFEYVPDEETNDNAKKNTQ